jgi:hypothetical protein
VIDALVADGLVVSCDTRKAAIMARAAAAGAQLINDVSALTYEPDALPAAAKTGLPVCLMHAQGDPKTMQDDPRYDNVLLDVYDWLEARVDEVAGRHFTQPDRCRSGHRLWQDVPAQSRSVAGHEPVSWSWCSAAAGRIAKGFYRRGDRREGCCPPASGLCCGSVAWYHVRGSDCPRARCARDGACDKLVAGRHRFVGLDRLSSGFNARLARLAHSCRNWRFDQA